MDDMCRKSNCVNRVNQACYDQSNCSICLESLFDVSRSVAITQCSHEFHLKCINEWLEGRDVGSRICAICRDPSLPLEMSKVAVSNENSKDDNFSFFAKPIVTAILTCNLALLKKELLNNFNCIHGDYWCPDLQMNVSLLFCAANISGGNADIVSFLISNGVNINGINTLSWTTALMQASIRNNLSIINVLIDSKVNIHACDVVGQTALFEAVIHGNLDATCALIDAGANVGDYDYRNYNVLMYAVTQGYLELTKILVKSNANAGKLYGIIKMAIVVGKASIAEALIECGSDVSKDINAFDFHGDNCTNLCRACKKGYLGVVKSMVNKGADLYNLFNDGSTLNALHVASDSGNCDLVEYLISTCKMDVNFEDKKLNFSPILIAIFKNDMDMCKFMISKGAIVSKNIFLFLSRYNCSKISVNLAKFLVVKGVSVDYLNDMGRTPLHLAVLSNSLHMAKILIDIGANINNVDENQESAFSLALNKEDDKLAKFLLSKGACDSRQPENNRHRICENITGLIINLLGLNLDCF